MSDHSPNPPTGPDDAVVPYAAASPLFLISLLRQGVTGWIAGPGSDERASFDTLSDYVAADTTLCEHVTATMLIYLPALAEQVARRTPLGLDAQGLYTQVAMAAATVRGPAAFDPAFEGAMHAAVNTLGAATTTAEAADAAQLRGVDRPRALGWLLDVYLLLLVTGPAPDADLPAVSAAAHDLLGWLAADLGLDPQLIGAAADPHTAGRAGVAGYVPVAIALLTAVRSADEAAFTAAIGGLGDCELAATAAACTELLLLGADHGPAPATDYADADAVYDSPLATSRLAEWAAELVAAQIATSAAGGGVAGAVHHACHDADPQQRGVLMAAFAECAWAAVETAAESHGEAPERYLQRLGLAVAGDHAGVPSPPTVGPDIPAGGRNQPCPCGSGRKYKHCHGARR